DATLGVAFAETGVLYPFFAAILGWLGVFLTGTDAGSNALFGSLQKITATEVWYDHHDGAMSNLTLEQAQVLICTANSTGGGMGKMIDAQSICVATAGTHQIGKEADIFKAVIWHSILLASIVGLLTAVQAYVFPFTRMVPGGGPGGGRVRLEVASPPPAWGRGVRGERSSARGRRPLPPGPPLRSGEGGGRRWPTCTTPIRRLRPLRARDRRARRARPVVARRLVRLRLELTLPVPLLVAIGEHLLQLGGGHFLDVRAVPQPRR